MPIQEGHVFVGATQMVVHECIDCHCLFAMSKEMNEKYYRNKRSFCCPVGHGQYYTGRSIKDELEIKKKQLASLKNECATLQECCIDYQAKAKKNNYRARAFKGQVTKLKKAY